MELFCGLCFFIGGSPPFICPFMDNKFRSNLCSSCIWWQGPKPKHALITFSIAALCLNRALTTGAPSGTSGALHK